MPTLQYGMDSGHTIARRSALAFPLFPSMEHGNLNMHERSYDQDSNHRNQELGHRLLKIPEVRLVEIPTQRGRNGESMCIAHEYATTGLGHFVVEND